ncbi:MAG: energy-coupling factor transporter ATPase [Lachnospiraceae bacterium]|nr:energy-coupling factor transporter ATPase [Lachnospiraceae bacterium]
MGIIQTFNLIYDYITRDENDNEIKVRAIDGIDIDVEKGQFIAILGRNGSGKSSFAKQINALLKPTSGTVIVDGMDTSGKNNKWKIRQKAGMVFQNPDNQLVAEVVEEDVAFGPENLALPTDEIWNRVNKALDAVNMTKHRMKAPYNLSGGQKQRVAIAGIIAMEPDCIILDEPTAMLDPVGRKEVIDAVTQLNKEKGITIILITHHMEETIGADRVFVMDKGKVLTFGTPSEVFSKVELLKSAGLEVPKVTELAYELKKSGLDLKDGIIDNQTFVDEVLKIYQMK